ncbi:MAG: 16S rRNA (cytosine(967)-C(5))-methyltransferase RsmB [Oscillospiraceae bacterium]|jgi:16S rRNA (cytosine967-C5)-methyltransferase|nr:16S rRNA (cytosine(967)-C(5))-methyltransferase RsmB [Oscillospiraceae bacterium]
MENPRETACRLLEQIYARRSYANLALDAQLKRQKTPPADAAFCTALVCGVIERRRTLDYQLEGLLAKPVEQLPRQTLAALRMGLYQLFYMDRVPDHAAIHESVELVKRRGAGHTAGLVNAVLRRAQGRGLQLPEGESSRAWGVRYACPEWLCALWRESYGEETARDLLEHSFGPAEMTLRTNTLRLTAEELRARLGGYAHPELPESCVLPPGCSPPKFGEGLFHAQDGAAQLCCKALGARPEETVLDLCAAPGGKSFTCAEMMGDRGKMIALDLYPQRLKLIEEGALRLGIGCIEARQGDATDPRTLSDIGEVDRVLCDVPCSGLGILRKKPDIREKMRSELDKLPKIQYAILDGGARHVRPGGFLVYATCTLNPAENEQVRERFAQEHTEFALLEERTCMPHIDQTDGFYFATFKRSG